MPLPPRLRWFLRVAGITLAVLFALFCVVPYLIPLPGDAPVAAEALAPPGGRFLTVGGIRTFLVEAGPKSGPAVVLVHGFGGSTFSFRKNVTPLAEAGFHVVTFDLPGSGLSDKRWETDYSHPAQADFLVAMMKVLGIARATLVGHSLGANIAAHVAERHPEVVEKLVFVAPVFFEGKAPGAGRWLLRFPPARRWAQIYVRRKLKPPGSGRTLRTGFGDPSLVTREVIEGYAAPRRMKDWDLALLGMVRDTPRSALARPLAEIRVPVLIVWGDRDRWAPMAAGAYLRNELPQAEWFVVPGAGHLVLEERPEAVDGRIVEFLRR
jgi:pimeloyl-ACP methyl ester carboxylesterase